MKRLTYMLFVAVCCFAAASCTSDDPAETSGKGDGYSYLSLTIKSGANGDPVSRSTPAPSLTRGEPSDSNYNEDFIDFDGTTSKDLHIFFYDTAGQDCIFFPETERLGLGSASDQTTKVITIRLKKEDGDTFEDFDADDLISENTVMYVVANSGLDRSAFMSGQNVKTLEQVMGTVVEAEFNKVASNAVVKQDKFVMDIRQPVYVAGWNNVANLSLKRVAAKIQMGIYNASVSGYTAESARVKMVNFVEKAALGRPGTNETYTPLPADYRTGDYIPIPLPDGQSNTPSTVNYAEPFYSYPNDWSSNRDMEPYLLLEVTWRESAAAPGSGTPYYYKLPLSKIPADNEQGAAHRDRMKRNYIYRYFATLTSLGGADPQTPVTLDSNLNIMGWDDQDVEVSIQRFDWLFVEEQSVIIYPVAGESVQTYLIPYRSSSPISLTPGFTKVWCREFDKPSNTMKDKVYSSGDPEYPTITLDHEVGGQRYIRVVSQTPTNYVQKDMTLRVQNEALLFANISVVHYPALYVSAKESSGVKVSGSSLEGNLDPGSNKNLFMVTTLAITGDETFENPASVRNKRYTIGDPKDPNTGLYVDDPDNAWVVSPKFVVQSTLGNARGVWAIIGYHGTITYANTVKRCGQYAEDVYGTGTWRVPTLAELYLIDKLQSDEKSAVRDALIYAWDAKKVWSAGSYLLDGTQPSASRNTVYHIGNHRGEESTETVFVGYIHIPLCVRDIYQ